MFWNKNIKDCPNSGDWVTTPDGHYGMIVAGPSYETESGRITDTTVVFAHRECCQDRCVTQISVLKLTRSTPPDDRAGLEEAVIQKFGPDYL